MRWVRGVALQKKTMVVGGNHHLKHNDKVLCVQLNASYNRNGTRAQYFFVRFSLCVVRFFLRRRAHCNWFFCSFTFQMEHCGKSVWYRVWPVFGTLFLIFILYAWVCVLICASPSTSLLSSSFEANDIDWWVFIVCIRFFLSLPRRKEGVLYAWMELISVH